MLTIDEFFARHPILTAGFEMTFDHNAENPGIAVGNLAGHLTTDLNLLFRFFAAVAMAASIIILSIYGSIL